MRIFVAGHKGMVGGAIMRKLDADGTHEMIVADRGKLDLTDQAQVRSFLRTERPDAVILAAAKVGGIAANNLYPAQFIYENLMIEANVIHQAYRNDIEQLLLLGSSCIYPRDTAQPMAEDALLTGRLEPTNEPYAIAKIAGIKLCESYNREYGTDYRSVMPTNLYGPSDNFHPKNAHVLPALMARFHRAVADQANEVMIWGSGTPRREFMHVDDMAAASLFVFNLDAAAYAAETTSMQSHINVGTGQDISIFELAQILAEVTGFRGLITNDDAKPDGAPRKLLDVTRLNRLGWTADIALRQGIVSTYDWYRSQLISGDCVRHK